LMLIVINSLFLINILLGTIQGSFKEKFNWKKFLFGFVKALVADACIFGLCYVLNLFALTLQLTKDITISTDVITTAEVIIILTTWALDLAKDIVEKVKNLKTLKYVSYDNVQINKSTQEEVG
jgi:hypothetical protein